MRAGNCGRVPVNVRDQQTGGRFQPELCRSHPEFLWGSSVAREPQAGRAAEDVEPVSTSRRRRGRPFLSEPCRLHREFLSAFFPSWSYSFDRRPSVGIVYDERTFLQSFRDQGALSIRIIVNDSNVRERKIQELQIGEASPIAPDDDIVGDAMSAFPHAPRYPIKRRLG